MPIVERVDRRWLIVSSAVLMAVCGLALGIREHWRGPGRARSEAELPHNGTGPVYEVERAGSPLVTRVGFSSTANSLIVTSVKF